jgi:hypothetical protein
MACCKITRCPAKLYCYCIAVNGSTARRIEAGKIGADLLTIDDVAVEVNAKIKAQASLFTKYARDYAFLTEIRQDSIILTLIEQGMFVELSKQIDNIRAKVNSQNSILTKHEWIKRYVTTMSDASDRGKCRALAIISDIKTEYPMLKYVHNTYGRPLEADVLADVLAYVSEK